MLARTPALIGALALAFDVSAVGDQGPSLAFEWVGGEGLFWWQAGNWEVDGEPAEEPPGCDLDTIFANVIIEDAEGPVQVLCSGGLGSVELGALSTNVPIEIAEAGRGSEALAAARNVSAQAEANLGASSPVTMRAQALAERLLR